MKILNETPYNITANEQGRMDDFYDRFHDIEELMGYINRMCFAGMTTPFAFMGSDDIYEVTDNMKEAQKLINSIYQKLSRFNRK